MDRTDSKNDTPMAREGSPAVLARDLRRRRPSMPPAARPHASNLIKQLEAIEGPDDLERMRPFMARSARLLAHTKGEG